MPSTMISRLFGRVGRRPSQVREQAEAAEEYTELDLGNASLGALREFLALRTGRPVEEFKYWHRQQLQSHIENIDAEEEQDSGAVEG